ncbi:MAG TPA: hypothetical protein VFW03_03650 [Gemmatimonadaceae bacterium]|nr:hypothetical protein [Gemmatimonadaceae bacterium]
MTSTTPPVPGDAPLETPLGVLPAYGISAGRAIARVALVRGPLFLSALVALSAMFAVAPLRDAQTGAAEARLRLPPGYIMLAPLCDVLDAMSTLTVRQHVALVVTGLALYAMRRRRRRFWRSQRPTLLAEFAGATAVVLAIVGAYLVLTLVDRPMAELEISDPDSVVVDFHSHTNASWDGRRTFTAERNRAWHEAAGFDVAYVTDHLPSGSVTAPILPARGATHTLLLPSFEIECKGMHVVVLGASPTEARAWCDGDQPDWLDGDGANSALSSSAVIIATLPGRLDRLAWADVSSVEAVDGAPRALDQLARDQDRVMAAAARYGLSLVTGSNLHGWGRTAIAWTAIEIPGWRALSPEALDARIRSHLRGRPDGSVHVIERRRVRPGETAVSLVSTLPDAAWNMLVTMSPSERLSWAIWIWLGWIGSRIPVRRRARRIVA